MNDSLVLNPSEELLEIKEELGQQLFCEFYINEVLSRHGCCDLKYFLSKFYSSILDILKEYNIDKSIVDETIEYFNKNKIA